MTQHDDERDALLRVLVEASRGQMSDTEWAIARTGDLTAQRAYVDAILAAGFHRTPTITEEMVERTAKAIYDADGRYSWTWEELTTGWREGLAAGIGEDYPHLCKIMHDTARAALTAALGGDQ